MYEINKETKRELTLKVYERLPIPKEKCLIGVKTGIIHNTGNEPAFFKENITGIIYPFWNYEFELLSE